MRSALPTGVAAAAAALGAANLTVVVEVGQLDALRSPDAWLPLTASLAGWLVARLSPRNVIAWLLLAMAVSSAVFGSAALVVLGDLDVPAIVHSGAAWLSAWVFLPSYLVAFLLVPLLYPDGRLPSRHWRPVLLASSGLVVVESFLLAFGARDTVAMNVENPLRVGPVGVVLGAVEPVVWLSMPVLAVVGVASLAQRGVVARGPDRSRVLALLGTALLGVVVLVTTGVGLVLGLLLPLVVAGAVAQSLHEQLTYQLELVSDQAAALRASRARITQAHDNARRRIERDLHDGAQQGLLALSMGLGRLAHHVEPPVRKGLEDLQQVAQQTLVELRRLASGTYPSALRELGVAAALRDAVGPDVAVRDHLGARAREETETALYFACLEAVTNARKHADASTVTVVLDRADDGGFRFSVTDDGKGLTCATGGSGIDGMADRLGACGGTLTIDSSPDRGTTVTGVAYDAPR